MGLFDIFKRMPPPIDEVFGEMKPLMGVFITCESFFLPLQKNIEVLIMSTESIPTEEQRNFYTELQKNYSGYKVQMIPIIEDTFRNADENFKIKDFDNEFNLVTIIVPDFLKRPLEWHISYENELDPNHVFSVGFFDYKPSHIQIDG